MTAFVEVCFASDAVLLSEEAGDVVRLSEEAILLCEAEDALDDPEPPLSTLFCSRLSCEFCRIF